ncbi:hypothetical protein [Siccirubricoccus phaeus]|uniref:hypothetical protein n=1 Tax=Siccirubricoccus phaeus TaxID=2595053 RepID=UPI0011F40645|nr:hypothetical protein [Siccirubricoccus phaeus]
MRLPARLILAAILVSPPLLGLPAGAQTSEAPNRGLRVPEQAEPANRGIRLPDQAEPPAQAAPVATRAAATRASAAGGPAAMTEAAAGCLLRHGAKAAGNTEAWRDIRRICTLYPGIE